MRSRRTSAASKQLRAEGSIGRSEDVVRDGVIGYVLKAYPRMSELFILSEVRRLEELGTPLRLFAIKPAEANDREPRHPVVDRIETEVEFLPAVTSLSRASLATWLRANWPAFRPSFWRVARRRPVGLARAALAAAAQAWRTRCQGGEAKGRVRELLRAASLADRLLTAPGVTHLHAHYAHDATTVTWLASTITGIPFSFTAHARDLYCEELNPAGLLRRKLNAARFAVTCTEANRSFLQRFDPETPVHRVYHGLNADFARLVESRPAPLGRSAAPFRVVGVGRLVEKKGFDVLIDAAATIRDGGESVEIVIAGPEGGAGPRLRALASERGLDGCVRFTGALPQDRLMAEYAAANAFCLPCRVLDDGDRDGIPNVLMEAMAAGLPVVTTGVSGIPELVVEGVTGLLVPPDDAAALAAALRRVRDEPGLSVRLAEAGRSRVLRDFEGSRQAARLADLYRTKAAPKGTPRPGIVGLARAFAPELRRELSVFVLSYAVALGTILAWVASPLPLKVIIDNVLGHRALPAALHLFSPLGPNALVMILSAAFLFATMVAAAGAAAERRMTSRIRERLGIAIRDRLLAHLQTLPPTLRSGHKSGELVYRLVGDVDLLVRLFTKTLPLLFRYAATALATCGALLWMAPRIGLLGLALIPLLFVLVRRYGATLAKASRRKRKREGEVAAFAQEVIRGLPIIQALGADARARHRFGEINARSLHAGVTESDLTARMEQSLEIARGLAIAVVTGGGALFVLSGRLTLGALTVLLSYMTQLLKPVDKVNDLAEATSRGLAAGGRLLALLDEQPLVRDRPGAIEIERAHGVVELKDVSFAYPGTEGRSSEVLKGVNLRLEPGRLTVLVGRSGAGKSTLMSLLVRLYDPTTGEIQMDGVAYPQIKLRSLRGQIAIMSQDLHLFSGTLREAISPTGPALSDSRLHEALELVALDEFVNALPGGLDAILAEDGTNLSGGQRQRLSLARAILMDRPILLLDEPLANVDAVSAAVILQALTLLRARKTCFAITHESALLQHADVVYRIDAGRIVEERPRVATPRLLEVRA